MNERAFLFPRGPAHAELFWCSDKWSVVELGLQGVATTPPKTPSKKASTKTASPNGEKHTSRSPRTPKRGHDSNRQQGDKSTPTSPVYSQDGSSYLADVSTLCYADASTRRSRALVSQRGRLGQVVRDFVKKMLPPSSGGRQTKEMSGESSRWSGFWH